jgi:ribonuclease Z
LGVLTVDLLGTGTPILDPNRCGSGVAVSGPDGWVLVDCGRGITHRVAQAELQLDQLLGVCLTHHHSDHVSDLATLAIARWSNGATTPLPVIAPEGPSAEFARSCLTAFTDQAFYSQAPAEAGARPSVEVRSFSPSHRPASVGVVGSLQLTSVLVDHHPIESAVGYRIDVELNSVVVSGDTAACTGIETMAADVDLLIHEAVLERAVPAQLLDWNASAESVGQLAQQARVKHLVLTHLIPAPGDGESEQQFADDARKGGFTGTITVARDLARIRVATTGSAFTRSGA